MNHRPLYLTLLIVSLVLALPFVACSGYSFYDGVVTYPHRIERYEAWDAIRTEHGINAPAVWAQTAAAQGWSTDEPQRMTQSDVVTQYLMGGVCGAFSLIWFLVAAIFAWLTLRAGRDTRGRGSRVDVG